MLVGTGAGVVLPGTLLILPHLMLIGARAAVSEYVAGPGARVAWVGIQVIQTLPSGFPLGGGEPNLKRGSWKGGCCSNKREWFGGFS